MAPPGGGRNVVSPRFLRHFVLIGITPFNDDTMTRIFGTLLSRYLQVRAISRTAGSTLPNWREQPSLPFPSPTFPFILRLPAHGQQFVKNCVSPPSLIPSTSGAQVTNEAIDTRDGKYVNFASLAKCLRKRNCTILTDSANENMKFGLTGSLQV